MEIVYATGTTVVDGKLIQAGTHWPKSDPLVKTRPDLFSDDPRYGLTYSTPEPPAIEQATAAPGERRSVKRG